MHLVELGFFQVGFSVAQTDAVGPSQCSFCLHHIYRAFITEVF